MAESKSSRAGKGSAEDAVAILKQDHATVKQLFQQFQSAGAGKGRSEIAQKVFTELEVHAQIEEEIFYPAVRAKGEEEGQDLVTEAIEEHQTVKDLIAELKGMPPGEEFDTKFQELVDNVEHHAEEEEAEMFPLAEEALGDELDRIGGEMSRRKRQLAGKAA